MNNTIRDRYSNTTITTPAEFIREWDGPRGKRRLYRVGRAYLIASAVVVYGRPETFLFHAREDGSVIDHGELFGSQIGTLDIDLVMREAGYDVH